MKKRWLYLVMCLPFVIGLLIGSINNLDLTINYSLYNVFGNPSQNIFGLIGSAILPLFSYFFVSFGSGYFLNFAIKEDHKFWKIFDYLVAIIGFGISVYFVANKYDSINAFGESLGIKILGFSIGIITQGLFCVFGYYISKKYGNKKYLWAIFLMFVMIALVLVPIDNLLLKNLARRPRFRSLLDGQFYNPNAVYTNWWESFLPTYKTLINPVSEDFKSFPSGHVSEAAITIMGLPYLSILIPKLKGKEFPLTIVGIIFTIIVAFSRMSMAAHYLTDVCIGALLMIIGTIIVNEINIKFVFKN